MKLATAEQIGLASYTPNKDGITKISKSSYMGYLMCPRQYWWNNIADVPRPPPTEAMVRGGQVHKVMEVGLLDGADAVPQAVVDEGLDVLDPAIESMTSLLHQIAWDLGGFDIVEVEKKHQVFEKKHIDGIGQVEIIWVGMIDAVLRHPDGGLILTELKTGNMGVGKLQRTRRELCFYKMILDKMNIYESITHFLYICPDYQLVVDREDKLLLEGSKKGKTLWLGDHNGIAILEPVGSRSINAFYKRLNDTLPNLFSHKWDMKWNDYFCMTWCDFNASCQQEIHAAELGLEGDWNE
tara:strand:+ start:1078 stop:1965 length:888 start_codon:yes stop_codon:yes gene_type:complete